MIFSASRVQMKGILAVVLGLGLSAPAESSTFGLDELFEEQAGPSTSGGSISEIDLEPELLTKLQNAQSLFLDSRFNAAEGLVRDVIEAAPDAAAGWHLLGLVLANQDRFDEAVEALDTAGNLYTQNAEPFIIQGDILLSLGRMEDAQAAYMMAAERDPSNWRATETAGVLLQRLGDNARATSLLTLAVDTAPSDRLFTRLRLAKSLLDADRTEEAAAVLEDFVSENPEDVRALAAAGHTNLAAARPAKAVEHFQSAVDLLPENASLNLFLGRAQLGAGDIAAAEAALQTARRLEPAGSAIYHELGKLYGATRDYEQALEMYEAGIDVQPDAPQLLRGARLAAYRLERSAVALDYARGVVEAPGATSQDYFWVGLLEEQTGHRSEAEQAYQAALDLDPSNWIAANNLAVLITESDPVRALELATSAEAERPDSTDVQATLGWANYHAGNLPAAEAIYQELATVADPKPHHLYRLGVIYLDQGKGPEGRSQLEAALALDDDFEDADDARTRLSD